MKQSKSGSLWVSPCLMHEHLQPEPSVKIRKIGKAFDGKEYRVPVSQSQSRRACLAGAEGWGTLTPGKCPSMACKIILIIGSVFRSDRKQWHEPTFCGSILQFRTIHFNLTFTDIFLFLYDWLIGYVFIKLAVTKQIWEESKCFQIQQFTIETNK